MGLDKPFAVDPEFQFIEIVLQLITFCLDQIPLVQLEDLHFVLFLFLVLLPLLDVVVMFLFSLSSFSFCYVALTVIA